MGDLVQSAASILSSAQRRAEEAAHNITNMATPGYRAKHSFSAAMDQAENALPLPYETRRIATTPGLLTETGNDHDLAISGDGFFELRGDGAPVYTRNGQFTRDADGRLLGLGGRAVQGVGGGDIILPAVGASILADGTVMDAERSLGRIAVMALDMADRLDEQDGVIRPIIGSTPAEVAQPVVRQGFLEGSNVSLGDEMITMMQAVRRAETGQRIMNVYDDLLGRVITTMGQAS